MGAGASSPAGTRPPSARGPGDGGQTGSPSHCPPLGSQQVPLGSAARSRAPVTPGWPRDGTGTLSVAGARSGVVMGSRMPWPGAASRSAPGLLPRNEPPGLAVPGATKPSGTRCGGLSPPRHRPGAPRPPGSLDPPRRCPWPCWISGEGGSLAPPTLGGTPAVPALPVASSSKGSWHPRGAFCLPPPRPSTPRSEPPAPAPCWAASPALCPPPRAGGLSCGCSPPGEGK